MDYRRIISEAWVYTQKNKKLIRWYGFLPALLTTTVGIGYIAYQFFSFKSSYLFNEKDESFLYDVLGFIMDFVKAHLSWTLPLVVFAIIFAILYFLFPTLAKASAIQMIARNRNGQKAGVGTGLRYGITSFLPLFEYHLLIKSFTFFSILIEMSFVLRNLGPSIFKLLLPVFIIIVFISLLMMLLFSYTDFFIVVDGEGVFNSIKKSSSLVVTHWKHTFLITLLMLIIGIRIVLQAILVFLIPALMVLITGYIATIALPFTGVIVGGVVGLVALVIAAYLNGIVDVFSYAVWTFTFLNLTSEKEISARDVFVDDIGEEQREHVDHKNLH